MPMAGTMRCCSAAYLQTATCDLTILKVHTLVDGITAAAKQSYHGCMLRIKGLLASGLLMGAGHAVGSSK